MRHPFNQLHAFHAVMEQPRGDIEHPYVEVQLPLRVRLIVEEFGELLLALDPGAPEIQSKLVEQVESWLRVRGKPEVDLPGVLDALCDLLYVIIGAAVTWGLPLPQAFDEVHRANMQKSTGEVRPDGKRLKPPGFKPPDIAGVLTRAQLGIYGLVETRRQAFYEMERICNLEQGPQAGHESLATFRASTMEKLVAVEAELKRRGYDPAGQPLESTRAERNE